MNGDEDSIQETKVLKRLSMNTRLSTAKIFDEDSCESETKSTGKAKSKKKNVKASPYKYKNRKCKIEYETDPAILGRRQKQIDYGKNTAGYDNYRKLVPKNKRTKDHPTTPIKNLKYSRRGWDGLIKIWRQKLHAYDPEEMKTNDDDDETDKDSNHEEEFENDYKSLLDFL